MRQYHQLTKHRPESYAASPGHMDWDKQPNPCHIFMGADLISLPHPTSRATPTYDSLFSEKPVPATLNMNFIG
ncbi:MAG: hypothetical protein OEM02_04170 [Desulfobulbaceae bacterium]|nr:hypothetical protein [Desulfobulbaceae bacterium]